MNIDHELILEHIHKHGTITADEAKETYGIGRLASRIYELRKNGYSIVTETVTVKNKRGGVSNYAKYRFAK